jgi:AAA15 family ATPase/GTPase
MNSLSFKNFRRFTVFPELEISPITFLVGKNNSGKSTFVKSLILIDNYLKSSNTRYLDFADIINECTNIVTFGRAINSHSKTQEISFNLQVSDYKILLSISGNKNDTKASVITLLIEDLSLHLFFEFKPQTGTVSLGRRKAKDDSKKVFKLHMPELSNQILNIKKELNNKSHVSKTSSEFLKLIDELNFYLDRQEFYKRIQKKSNEITNYLEETKRKLFYIDNMYEAESDYNPNISLWETLPSIIDNLAHLYKFSKDEKLSQEERESYEKFRGFYDDKLNFEKSFSKLRSLIANHSYVYLGAFSVKQKSLFLIRDFDNPISQAVHEFKQIGIGSERSSDAYIFIRKWMKNFEIGDDIIVNMTSGEAYEVLIKRKGDMSKIQLADKGMGSIQAMLLILRLSIIIHKAVKYKNSFTLLIEEPELNLHPALQGVLADMFHEVYHKYKINFIIETHSEYLIRSTQLIVKENDYEIKPNENPFTVIYFDAQKNPWSLMYRNDGVFINDFGPGFFDVSSQQAISLLKSKKNG